MLKAAIWGVGTWGQTLVDSVQGKSPLIQFTTAIVRTPEKYEQFALSRGLELGVDPAAVLANPAIDAVVIATANSKHAEHARQAAHAGKHVLVEKPFGLTAEEARSAVAACGERGVVLGFGFNRRFLPSLRDMKAMMEDDTLGRILHIEGQHSGPTGLRMQASSWRGTAAEAPGGGMTARGIHIVDAMIHLCGPVASVFAMSDRRVLPVEMDDTTSMLFRFASGATGYLGTIMATGNFWRIHAFGTRGWAEMRGERKLIRGDLDGRESARDYEAVDITRAEIEAFARSILDGVPYPLPADEAVHGTAVLEAIVRSAATRTPVTVE